MCAEMYLFDYEEKGADVSISEYKERKKVERSREKRGAGEKEMRRDDRGRR